MPGARQLAFEAATQRKGRVLEQVRNWRQHLRGTVDAGVRRQMGEWQTLLECRTSLTLALGYRDFRPSVVGGCGLDGTDLAGRYERLLSDLRTARTEVLAREAVRAIDVLRERGDAIEASLNRAIGRGNAIHDVPVDAIGRALGDDELLIEFVSYRDTTSRERTRRYGAFQLDRGGTVEWLALGPAAPVDSAVNALLTAANDWTIAVRNGEALGRRASETTARDVLSDLSKWVWAPIGATIASRGPVRRLRIAPDASLNLVPFEQLSDGRELIDRFVISYLPAGRDLADEDAYPSAAPPAVLVSPGASRRGRAARTTALRADALTYLEQAEGEAADLRRLIPRAVVHSTADATEQRVKSLRAPSLLHIVGHGLVVGQEDCAGAPCSSTNVPSNEMALSAIVLEEAYGRAAGPPDDGLLSAPELQSVDLRGTEMLVPLSGSVDIPVNVAVVPSKAQARVSILTGFDMRRR